MEKEISRVLQVATRKESKAIDITTRSNDSRGNWWNENDFSVLRKTVHGNLCRMRRAAGLDGISMVSIALRRK